LFGSLAGISAGGLTADCLNFVFSKSADQWSWGSFEERLGDGHTSGLPHRSISIVADGGWGSVMVLTGRL
jgi:hypothetical protein